MNATSVVLKFGSSVLTNQRMDLSVVEGVASGDVLDLGTGMVAAALGLQHRSLEDFTTPDSLSAAGENGFPGGAGARETRGDQTVTAIFGEVVVPFNDWAELQLAVRREDYGGSIGSTTDPKISTMFRPTDWLSIRGSYGTSFQAPTTRQTSLSTGFVNVTDNVELVNGVPTCVGPAGSFGTSTQTVGSDSLTPQTADNFNLGMSFTTEAFSASVDYWSFDYDNLIAVDLSPQALIDRDCADDGVPNDPRILRDAVGQIRVTRSEFVNVGSLRTEGIDLEATYSVDPGQLGSLVLTGRATYVDSFSYDVEGDGNRIEGVGKRNFSSPFHTVVQWRANTSMRWFLGNHQVLARVRYLDDIINDQSNHAPVDSQTTLDLQYEYTVDELFGLGDHNAVLTFGINNVFDEDPRNLRRHDNNGNEITQEIDPVNWTQPPGYAEFSGVDIRGRMTYARIRYRF